MFITRGELGPENLGELKILAKYRQPVKYDSSSSMTQPSIAQLADSPTYTQPYALPP